MLVRLIDLFFAHNWCVYIVTYCLRNQTLHLPQEMYMCYQKDTQFDIINYPYLYVNHRPTFTRADTS